MRIMDFILSQYHMTHGKPEKSKVSNQ